MIDGVQRCVAGTRNPSVLCHLKRKSILLILSRWSCLFFFFFHRRPTNTFTLKCLFWHQTTPLYIHSRASCLSSGIPNRHHLRPDVDGQPAQIQQHDEETDSEQQHGWTYLAPGHHLQELQERRFPLDYNAQPAAQDMERREDTLHLKVISETFVSIDYLASTPFLQWTSLSLLTVTTSNPPCTFWIKDVGKRAPVSDPGTVLGWWS